MFQDTVIISRQVIFLQMSDLILVFGYSVQRNDCDICCQYTVFGMKIKRKNSRFRMAGDRERILRDLFRVREICESPK